MEMSAEAISAERPSMQPSSPARLTSESAKLVWLVFDACMGKGSRNLLADEFADAHAELDAPGDVIAECSETELTSLEQSGERVGLLAEKRFGSEKSGNASSDNAVVETVRRAGS